MSRALEALWLRAHEERMAVYRPTRLDLPEPCNAAELRCRPAHWATPGPKGQSERVKARIRAMREAGESVVDIAQHVGLSTRQVQRLLKGCAS